MVGHAHIPHHTTQALHHCPIPLATCLGDTSQVPGASDAGDECSQQVQGCMSAAVGCISVADKGLGEQGNEGGGVQDVQDVGAGGCLAQQLDFLEDAAQRGQCDLQPCRQEDGAHSVECGSSAGSQAKCIAHYTVESATEYPLFRSAIHGAAQSVYTSFDRLV